MYYYLYKITNTVNGKIYIGIHSTDNLEDGYMGSGTMLRRAYNKHGIENFQKEIIQFFDNPEELSMAEKTIVNEDFVKQENNYNITTGGYGSWYISKGMVTVRDSNGNCFNVSNKDPRFLSGELKHVSTGLVNGRDKNGNTVTTSMNDKRFSTGELIYFSTGKIVAKDKEGNTYYINSNDERYKNGTLIPITKNRIWIKNIETGVFNLVEKTDERVSDGKHLLQNHFLGKKHKDSTKETLKIRCKERFQKGFKGSMYGRKWIHSKVLIKNITILKTEKIPEGWEEGKLQKTTGDNGECKIFSIKESIENKRQKEEEKIKRYEERLKVKMLKQQEAILMKQKKEQEREDKRKKLIGNLREMYYEYCKSGYKGVKERFAYQYSKPNLVRFFAKYLPEFVPQNGKTRGK